MRPGSPSRTGIDSPVVVRVFDPSVHRQYQDNPPVVVLNRSHDPRYVLCQRPLVITGGELGAEMLEVQQELAKDPHIVSVYDVTGEMDTVFVG